ncbi:MAG TPA: hypothetical protein VJL29_05200, partial [Thermoguttaceae bacterium]|nr:hypothetical protein [Thermoguttaceae bacterium]
MQRYWLSLLTLATLGLLAAGTDAAGPVSSSPFAPLERLDTAARATWVEDSLGRLDEANRVVLAPAAVAKQRARLGQTLDSFVKNQADWQVQVARFESELALSQRAAIEHLTRRYRMDAYEAFRGDRDGYDVRRSQLERMLADWRSCRSPSAEQHKVIRWLTTAANHLADRGTPLPPLPRFEGAGATRIATDSS